MILGSFTVNGEQIDVQPDYSQIDGRFYHLTVAGQEIAVTNYRGMRVENPRFAKDALQAGLREVLRRSIRN